MSTSNEKESLTEIKQTKGFFRWFKKIKLSKNVEYVIALVLGLIVVVIFLSSCNGSKETNKTDDVDINLQNNVDLLTYSEAIEHKLENVLSSVKGCSNVNVMVLAKTTPILVLAEENEEKTTDSGQNSTSHMYTVYVENGSSKTPMILYQSAPEIVGILVVARGAGDPNVKLKLVNAISALVGIEVSKIEVLEGI